MLGNPTKLADYPRIQQAKIRLAKDKLDIGNDTENFIEEPGNDSPLCSTYEARCEPEVQESESNGQLESW